MAWAAHVQVIPIGSYRTHAHITFNRSMVHGWLLCLAPTGCIYYEAMPTTWASNRWNYFGELRAPPPPPAPRLAPCPATKPCRRKTAPLTNLKRFQQAAAAARAEIEHATKLHNFSWQLGSTTNERIDRGELLTAVRRKFGGIIFVGDSQVRELAWSATRLMGEGQAFRYSNRAPHDELVWGSQACSTFDETTNTSAPIVLNGVEARYPLVTDDRDPVWNLSRPCVPRAIGRYGFTASIGPHSAAQWKGRQDITWISSPAERRSTLDICNQIQEPHNGLGGILSVAAEACSSDFFVAYHALWGASAVQPSTLPDCLLSTGRPRRRLLWVLNGASLHELEQCAPQRLALPQTVLANFFPSKPSSMDHLHTVVWQPAAGGFLQPGGRDCAGETNEQLAEVEKPWLREHGVLVFDYATLAAEYAPFMMDGRHFSYYFARRCASTSIELADLGAHLALSAGLGRTLSVCRVTPPSHWSGMPASRLK